MNQKIISQKKTGIPKDTPYVFLERHGVKVITESSEESVEKSFFIERMQKKSLPQWIESILDKENAQVLLLEDYDPFPFFYRVHLKNNYGLPDANIVHIYDPSQVEEALKRSSFSPDLIICDINMPKMTGPEFIKLVKAGKFDPNN